MSQFREVFYGGAGGGGKSDALLMLVLQDEWIDQPDYSALILRKTFVDLNQPEGVLTRAHEWLDGKPGVTWEAKHNRFVFASGAMIQFGHCNGPRDHLKYRGGKYNVVCWDELTDFQENQYTFLFSRQRRPEGSTLPLITASASNPGGPGHAWVKTRLVDGSAPDRIFIPANYEDNPHLDQKSYGETLDNLLPVERARIKHGDWTILDADTLFQRDWFPVVDKIPDQPAFWVRSWDTGVTENAGDPSVGLKMARIGNDFYVTDMIKGQWGPEKLDQIQKDTAKIDGPSVTVVVEEEPGSGSRRINQSLAKSLTGFRVVPIKTSGSKYSRAIPAARAAMKGRVILVNGPWIQKFLSVVTEFTGREELDAHDDEVDAFSLGFNFLDSRNPAAMP